MSKNEEFFCCLENGDYGTFYNYPLEYDAVFKNMDHAIDFAKKYEHGVVHCLLLSSDGMSTEHYIHTNETYSTFFDKRGIKKCQLKNTKN